MRSNQKAQYSFMCCSTGFPSGYDIFLLLPWQANIGFSFGLSVSNSWYVSFILVKNLISPSLCRLQCSRKSCSLSDLSHTIFSSSSLCLRSLFSPVSHSPLCLCSLPLFSIFPAPSLPLASLSLGSFYWHEC